MTNGTEAEEERMQLSAALSYARVSGRTTSKTTMRLAAWDCGINFNSFKETVILPGLR